MSTKVVVGANFGDEGKGLMANLFCACANEAGSVLGVRYNGGAQAGHTVSTKEGHRVVFRSLSSGTLSDRHVDTYIGKEFIYDPKSLVEELYDLQQRGIGLNNIFVNREARVNIPSDAILNRLMERFRGADKHGSCGFGIFETVKRSLVKNVALQVKDLDNLENIKSAWRWLEDYYTKRMQSLGMETIMNDPLLRYCMSEESANNFYELCAELSKIIKICDDTIINSYKNVVFEAGQGLLLSTLRRDYFPNITAADTGVKNAIECLNAAGYAGDIEVCYITRTYQNRHGVGRMDSECPKDEIGENIVDLTNEPNEFQDSMRYGLINPITLRDRIWADFACAESMYIGKGQAKLSLAVTHLNETDGLFRNTLENGEMREVEQVLEYMGIKDYYTSDGMTKESVKEVKTTI
jgi:adenylosuccinate synthase